MRGALATLACALAASGCGGVCNCTTPPGDLGMPRDLSPSPDLAAPPDLTTAAFDLAGSDLAGDVTQGHGTVYRYVWNAITLPKSRADFALDLNGDGKADNQLGNILGALAAQNFDAQAPVDQAVASGSLIELASLQTADPALQNDATVASTVQAGQSKANPDFSGNGSFTVDQGKAPGDFFGRLIAANFASNDPVTTTHPVDLTLDLPLLFGAPTTVPLHGAHLSFDTGVDAKSGAPALLGGRLQGSVKQSDVQTLWVPQIAAQLSLQIQLDPNSQQSMQLEQIFDTGNCVNPDNSMALAGDKVIGPCEVATNAIIQNILAPDVQIYDAMGNYAPNPANTKRDSLSIGIGFTAIQAAF